MMDYDKEYFESTRRKILTALGYLSEYQQELCRRPKEEINQLVEDVEKMKTVTTNIQNRNENK